MDSRFLKRAVEVAVLAITMAAIFQEFEKPEEERKWHGCILKVPYDFRFPTLGRIKASYWNPANSHIFTPEVFGVGWAINLHALREKLRIMGELYCSEEDYLMPTRSIREIIEQSAATE